MQHLIKYLIFWIVAWFRVRAARPKWAEAAQQLGGTFDPDQMRIDATREGVPFSITMDRSVTTNTLIFRTILTAAFSGPSMFEMDVYKEGFFSSLGKSLGGQDIEVGEPIFDKACIVKSNSEQVAREWLSESVRNTLLSNPKYGCKVEKKVVTFSTNVLESSPEALVAAASALQTIAAGGGQMMQRWQEALASLGAKPQVGSLEESAPLEFESRGVHLSVAISHSKTGFISKTTEIYTTITARLQNNLAPFYLYQHQATPTKEALALPEVVLERQLAMSYALRAQQPNQELLASITEKLSQAQPDIVSVDGKNATAVYSTLMLSADRLVPLVEALTTLALHSEQLYR